MQKLRIALDEEGKMSEVSNETAARRVMDVLNNISNEIAAREVMDVLNNMYRNVGQSNSQPPSTSAQPITIHDLEIGVTAKKDGTPSKARVTPLPETIPMDEVTLFNKAFPDTVPTSANSVIFFLNCDGRWPDFVQEENEGFTQRYHPPVWWDFNAIDVPEGGMIMHRVTIVSKTEVHLVSFDLQPNQIIRKVDTGKYQSIDELPEHIKEKMAMLCMVPTGEYIPLIGRRQTEVLYWVYGGNANVA
jgi:hypothetical protein